MLSITANDRCARYRMTVGPMGRLLTSEERERHKVGSFEPASKPSGGTTRVRAHERRNPLRPRERAENFDEVAQNLYQVFDAEGAVRYFGEGRVNRPEMIPDGN